jgi:hypothetical protein
MNAKKGRAAHAPAGSTRRAMVIGPCRRAATHFEAHDIVVVFELSVGGRLMAWVNQYSVDLDQSPIVKIAPSCYLERRKAQSTRTFSNFPEGPARLDNQQYWIVARPEQSVKSMARWHVDQGGNGHYGDAPAKLLAHG